MFDCDDTNGTIKSPVVWYKDTDNDGYSDGITIESCARPEGYKSTNELRAIAGDRNDNDPNINPGMTEVCGDNIDNDSDGLTDEDCERCVVAIQATPSQVWPRSAGSNQTTSILTISLAEPAPPEGCTVNLTVEPTANSGGHNHGGTRPRGTLNDYSVSLYNWDTEPKTVTYTSSEISGEERIIATAQGGNTNEAMITVRVDALLPLGTGTTYNLTGRTNAHPVNHFGTSTTNDRVVKIASKYVNDIEATLGVNDMSLEKGGLFDVNSNWRPEHALHRRGESIDIDRCAYKPGTPNTGPL